MASEASTPQRARQSEFARLLGKSPAYVSRLVSTGTLSLDGHGLLDVEAAVAALITSGDPAMHVGKIGDPTDTPIMQRIRAGIVGKAGFTPPTTAVEPPPTAPTIKAEIDPALSYQAARTLNEHYKARNEKLKYEQAAGNLINKTEADAAQLTLARALRDALLSIPARLADQLAIETNPIAVRRMIDKEVRHALTSAAEIAADMIGIGADLEPDTTPEEPT